MPTLATNKRALHDYSVLQTFEGGLVLTGAEVKAVKNGSTNLKGAFLTVDRGELFIVGMHIGRYAPAGNKMPYDENRRRKVLVHKREIATLAAKSQAERLTLVPISLYTRGNLVKLEFALAKGKHAFEKRAVIKKRDLDREIRSYGA